MSWRRLRSGLLVPREYAANAVTFDGTNDFLRLASDLAGNANSKVGIVSLWMRFNGGDGSRQVVYTSNNQGLTIQRWDDNILRIRGFDAGGTEDLKLYTSNTMTADSTWHHVLGSWDLANGNGALYVDDVSDLGTTSLVDDNIDLTQPDHQVGDLDGGGQKLDADIADLYINFAETIAAAGNTIAEADRRKFIDASGKPVNLGSDGSGPTGNAPIMFFSGTTATWHTNDGTGGGFTENGALTDAPTSPSD